MPDHNEDLWVLLSAAVGVPINTSADLLAAAVETFVANNPGYPWSGDRGKPSVMRCRRDQAEARAAIRGCGTRLHTGARHPADRVRMARPTTMMTARRFSLAV